MQVRFAKKEQIGEKSGRRLTVERKQEKEF